MSLTPHADAELPAKAWRVHPARERPGRAFAAGVAVAGVALAVPFSARSSLGALLAALWLLVQLRHFFLPSWFAIDDQGITARDPLGRKRYRWRDVRRFVTDRHGGYLSTRARHSRLDAVRGMHLLFGPDRSEIEAAIRLGMERGGCRCDG